MCYGSYIKDHILLHLVLALLQFIKISKSNKSKTRCKISLYVIGEKKQTFNLVIALTHFLNYYFNKDHFLLYNPMFSQYYPYFKCFFSNPHLRMFIDLRERQTDRDGDRKRERHRCEKHRSVASGMHPNHRLKPTTQVSTLTWDRTLNLWVYWTTLQPTEQPDQDWIFPIF